MSDDPTGPALAFGVAALGSCPHPLAIGWAFVGTLLALGQTVPVPVDVNMAAAMVSLGLACAVFTRVLTGEHGLLTGAARELVLALIAVVALTLLFVPDGRALLETADGEPLYVTAFAQDLSNGVRAQTIFRASADVSIVSPGVKVALVSSLFVCLFVVLLGRMRNNWDIRRVGWTLAVVAGSVLAVLGLAGQFGLLGTAIELSDVYGDWKALSALSSSGLVLDAVNNPEFGYIGFSSRPAVDALRVLVGCTLLWTGLKALRASAHAQQAAQATMARPGLLIGPLCAFSALVFLQHHGGVFHVLCAVLLLALVAGFLGRQARAPRVLLQALSFGALCLVVLAMVGPTAGWVLIG